MIDKAKLLYQKRRVVGGKSVYVLLKPTTGGGLVHAQTVKRNGRTYFEAIEDTTSAPLRRSQSVQTRKASKKGGSSNAAAASILRSLSKKSKQKKKTGGIISSLFNF